MDHSFATCKSKCEADASCAVVHWQGKRLHNYDEAAAGLCFLHATCDEIVEYHDSVTDHDDAYWCMEIQSCDRSPPLPAPPLDRSRGPAPFFNDVASNGTRYALFSVLDREDPTLSLETVLGPVQKHPASPLFRPTEAWEHDVDNGFSSVLYDPTNSLGQGVYRVYYTAADDGFGQGIPGESKGTATLYATSEDGLTFTKPNLGKFVWRGSSQNNILFAGANVAVYDDSFNAVDPSERIKLWGNMADITGKLGFTAQLGASAVSSDGLSLTGYRTLQEYADPDPDTMRFDAQVSLFYDPSQSSYTGTMRAFRPCATCGTCGIWWQPEGGCINSGKEGCGAIECNQTVRAIGTSVSTAGASFQDANWSHNVEVHADHEDPTRQFYSQINFPFYNVYLGITMILDAADPHNTLNKSKVHCELSWSPDSQNWERIQPGSDFIPLGSLEDGEFDSHVCFASAHPVRQVDGSEVRIYYMGGDGPHYSPATGPLHRNTSFGLATLRPDGFVGVRPNGGETGVGRTVPLLVSGPQLTVTADAATGGSVIIRVRSEKLGGSFLECQPLVGQNVTDFGLLGCDLGAIVGEQASLEIEVTAGATVYTVGFVAGAALVI